ncbi:MAG: HlyD family secretion protein [Tannerellaceae bacterium]
MKLESKEPSESSHGHKIKSLKLRKRFIRNIILNTICISLAFGGIVWGGYYFGLFYEYEITNDSFVDQYITPVNVRVPGYIKTIRFMEHTKVNQGDTLLELDPIEYQLKLAEAEASLSQAIAAAEALRAGVNAAQSNVAVANATILENKSYLSSIEEKARRYENLYSRNAVSKQEYEQVTSDFKATQAKIEALIMRKDAAIASANEAGKKLLSADATITQRRAEVDLVQLNLSYTVVTAPQDGYTGRRTLEVGQLMQAGQTVSSIIGSENKWITANFKESQIANIYIGQEVIIKVDAIKNRKFHGQVVAISEATGSKYSLLPVDNSAGNFVKVQQRIPVRIDLVGVSDQDLALLRAGMMVEVEAKIKK